MSWTLLVGLVLALGFALSVAALRRAELARMRRSVQTRDQAIRQGSDKAQFQFPVVDLSRCLGCGTCVAACPEEGVLELVHGQAMVTNGALNALPNTVRRSKDIPNVDSQRMMLRKLWASRFLRGIPSDHAGSCCLRRHRRRRR